MSKFMGLLLILLSLLTASCGTEKKIVEGPQPIPPRLPPGEIPTIPPPVPDPGGTMRFNVFETQLLSDLIALPEAERENSRFLVLCDRSNEGDTLMEEHIAASHKVINQLSTEVRLRRTTGVGTRDCIRRIDRTDFDISVRDWVITEDADPFQFESNTERGLLIKQLTQARRPWIHVSNFAVTTHTKTLPGTNRAIYYEIIGLANNIAGIYQQLGVDRQQVYDDIEDGLIYMGMCDSPIALGKCRSIERMESRFGSIWLTFDISLNSNANLLRDPFPPEARSNRIFDAEAHECIFDLPNELNGYCLANAINGNLESFAPTNIVENTRTQGLSSEINLLTCNQCHIDRVEENNDELGNHIQGNQNFNIDDRRIAEAITKNEAAREGLFNEDTDRYCDALREIDNDCDDIDTINQLTDDFRRPWDLGQVAAWYWLSEEEMATCIRSSPVANQNIGFIINGGAVQQNVIENISDDIVRDCDLFEDKLGE